MTPDTPMSPVAGTPSDLSGADAARVLLRMQKEVMPEAGAQARIQNLIRAELRAPHVLHQVRDALEPAPGLAEKVWSHVSASIDPLRSLSLWDRLRESIAPAENVRDLLWSRVSARLEPSYSHALVSRPVKWVAAFAVLLITVRVSPLLFLAPASLAGSSVTLFSTRGNVEVLIGSLWQPIRGEITLSSPTRLQTQEGEATITNHDDAVFRLSPHTRGQLLDLSDRPEASAQETTVALEAGELWVLGLVPKHVRAVAVVTDQGRILIHEGSVSIRQSSNEVVVRVFDRRAVIARHGKQLTLVTGEQAVLTRDNDFLVTKMDSTAFQESWVAGNLTRDAAHQREIAQLQQERLATGAGILPGSTLYPVKRLAETVEVLFSLSEEERTRKIITQANTRLSEAAALLQSGGAEEEAQHALQQYKDTLLYVANGSGGSKMVQSLIQTEVVDAGSATVGAALPGDPSYALKQAVDDTIAALPTTVSKPDVEGEVLLDQLAAVKREAAEGDKALAREQLSELSDTIASLETTGVLSLVSADVRQEAQAVARQVTAAVEGPAQGIGLSLGAPSTQPVSQENIPVVRPLDSAELTTKVQEIRGRIFLFGTKKAQYDALEDQIALLLNHPDRGRILRELAKALPRTGLAQRVLREIRAVQEEVQQQVTASGGVTETTR